MDLSGGIVIVPKNYRICFSWIMRIWMLVLLVTSGYSASFAQETSWKDKASSARDAYLKGDYDAAITDLNQVLADKPASASAMYDLGNCFLQKGDLGYAILWYERALKYRPYDQDILHNLAVAKARRDNPVVEIREFFLARWLLHVADLMSTAWWAVTGIMLFWIIAGLLIARMMGRSPRSRRKLVWLTAIGFVLCVVFGSARYHRMQRKDLAVVVEKNTLLTIAPEPGSKLVARVGAGEKVVLLDSLQQYYKIRLANYEHGWLPVTAVERI